MMDIQQVRGFIHALTGSIDTSIEWRCIHDKDKKLPAHNYTGTITQTWDNLVDYNNRGYGVFCAVNALDGKGRDLSNVLHIRAHVVDLDNTFTAQANLQHATEAGASFTVQSSPGKYHVYFRVQPYTGNEFYTTMQRKLAQLYDGDRKVIDATRVMRVPGFMHLKGEPVPVKMWSLPSFERVHTYGEMSETLQHVNVIEHHSSRTPLGAPELSAPSPDWLKFSLTLADPATMDRVEWLSFSAAFKQAGWLHFEEQELLDIWLKWCTKYEENDEGENRKLWKSITNTEVGWKSIERKTPVKAYMMFGHKEAPIPTVAAGTVKEFGEILSHRECELYFENCFFICRSGQIFSRAGRFMNATQFNGRYGGKQFIISSTGKMTDEPWKAATRSTCYTIPKVDHTRFLPEHKTFEIIDDGLGRQGLNTYIPAKIASCKGDITQWFDWFNRIIPDEEDKELLWGYMAHCVKYPGHKIAWAPLVQSAEGIGKTIFKEVLSNALGDMYVYSPKAPELVKSGSTFNAWMRGKLMILVDEIKIDERRELIEILKPMITDKRVEIQSKGVDQEMEDNPANWIFFSNFKDAIPINRNGRRYSIFYSSLQSKADILNAGMDGEYFNTMWDWLRNRGGIEAITYWLLNYPIEEGAIPVRAPETASYEEAIAIGRSPMEVVIADCIGDNVPGFKGGYVSVKAVIKKSKEAGIRQPTARAVQSCLDGMGLVHLGRAVRPYIQEDITSRSEIYGTLSQLPVEGYGKEQGYE